MLKDKEVRRVIRYANSLGLKVRFKKEGAGRVGAEYVQEDKRITVYTIPAYNRTDIVLMLLHEIGHHLDFIHRNKRDSKRLGVALERENNRKPGDPPIPRTYRQFIYNCEYAGTEYMPTIAKELDLKIPIWKVLAEQRLDRWIYLRYVSSGDLPSLDEIIMKRREYRRFYRETT